MTETEDTAAFRKKYEAMRPQYESLVQEVCHVLETKIASTGLVRIIVTGRVKTIESFEAKIGRKQYSNPTDQMTDLAGARVVCSYTPDLDTIGDVIEEYFHVLERIDKSDDLGVDRMGYNGKAYVVQLGTQYSGVRYEDITALKCEIQIRTILQDAWAIIGHHLTYKKEAATPDRLRRDLNNVASLLEIAQGIFDNVREKREAYILEIESKQNDQAKFLNQPIDYDTFIAYTKWKFPNLPTSEEITQLALRDIDPKDFSTLRDIDRAVNLAKIAVDTYHQENPEWFKFGTDFITKSLGFVSHRFRGRHPFSLRTHTAFRKYGDLVVSK